MKICFLARPSFDVYSTELYKKLKMINPSIEGVFITTNTKETEKVKKYLSNVDGYIIYETSTFLKENWDKLSQQKLSEYEKKYDCAPIWSYIYSDRFLIKRGYEYTVKIAAGLFAFYEKVYKETQPNYYYSECISTLQCYVGYIIGKKLHVRYLTQMCARGSLDSTYHYFTFDPYQYNADFDKHYRKKKYTDEERIAADSYLTEFEEKNLIPPAMNLERTAPKIDKTFLLSFFRYIKGRIDPKLNDKYSYMYYKSYYDQLNPIIYYFRYQRLKKKTVKPDYKRKYIFFPLHFQPEASTCVCAEKYEKQLYYIDSLAKSLPGDTVLYVKEHYVLLGHRDYQFYKELNKYPNVFLIDPWESSRKLIVNAFAVTTLTGTAGFEAMLLRKPVIIGGHAVYENAPGVIKVDDIFGRYIQEMREWKQPERDEIISYLCECFRTYHKGNIYCQNHPQLLDDNIDDIVNALYVKLIYLQDKSKEDI